VPSVEHAQNLDQMMAALAPFSRSSSPWIRRSPSTRGFRTTTRPTFSAPERPGFWITLREAMVMMIIVSDNPAPATSSTWWGSRTSALTPGGRAPRHRATLRIPPKTGPTRPSTGSRRRRQRQGLRWSCPEGNERSSGSPRAFSGTPALCQLGLDSFHGRAQDRLPSLLPLGTKVAPQDRHGPPLLQRRRILFRGIRPLCVLTAYTVGVPTAGRRREAGLRGRVPLDRPGWARLSYDELGGR